MVVLMSRAEEEQEPTATSLSPSTKFLSAGNSTASTVDFRARPIML